MVFIFLELMAQNIGLTRIAILHAGGIHTNAMVRPIRTSLHGAAVVEYRFRQPCPLPRAFSLIGIGGLWAQKNF
jgi:hypothetical protein